MCQESIRTLVDEPFDRKRRDAEDGQGLAEYGLILALVALVCIGALTALGGGISAALAGLTSSL